MHLRYRYEQKYRAKLLKYLVMRCFWHVYTNCIAQEREPRQVYIYFYSDDVYYAAIMGKV